MGYEVHDVCDMLNMVGPWKITKDEESRYIRWVFILSSNPYDRKTAVQPPGEKTCL